MINDHELATLLKDIESDRVERKESFSSSNSDKFSQTICAFANDLPNHKNAGYLIIGAKDDGSPANLTVTDQLLLSLADLRSSGNIQPLPHMNVQKFILDNHAYVVIEVMPSDFPPVRYKGRVWVRIGSSTRVTTEQEERTLIEKRISNAKNYDSCAVRGSTLDDLSLPLFSTYRQQVIAQDIIDANHRSIKNQLETLRFYDTRNECVTNAGLLLFGKNPRYYLPGAYIQYLKISGTRLTDNISDQAEISGDLLSVLRELDTRIKVNIQSLLEQKTILSETLVVDYPERAIRELLMNAVMHRDYQSNAPVKFYWFSDRIEIHSPGGLYGTVTMETLETSSDYRNPVIAEAMKALGYVNRYGFGIQNAQKYLKDNGNPPAAFQSDGRVFLATITRKPR